MRTDRGCCLLATCCRRAHAAVSMLECAGGGRREQGPVSTITPGLVPAVCTRQARPKALVLRVGTRSTAACTSPPPPGTDQQVMHASRDSCSALLAPCWRQLQLVLQASVLRCWEQLEHLSPDARAKSFTLPQRRSREVLKLQHRVSLPLPTGLLLQLPASGAAPKQGSWLVSAVFASQRALAAEEVGDGYRGQGDLHACACKPP